MSVLRVMVTGSRGWADEATLRDTLDMLMEDAHDEAGKSLVVMHGGAEGADTMASWWALARGVRTHTFLPNKSRPSPQRYHERNDRMLGHADFVLAFWDGKSRGTQSVLRKAEAQGIRHRTVYARRVSGAIP